MTTKIDPIIRDAIEMSLHTAALTLSPNKTKMSEKSVNIDGVKPKDLMAFMLEKGIPEDADFDWRDDNHLRLTWDIVVDTTEEEKMTFNKIHFPTRFFRLFSQRMIALGYKRIPTDSDSFKKGKEIWPFDFVASFNRKPNLHSKYDSYLKGDLEPLIEYYSQFFKKQES